MPAAPVVFGDELFLRSEFGCAARARRLDTHARPASRELPSVLHRCWRAVGTQCSELMTHRERLIRFVVGEPRDEG